MAAPKLRRRQTRDSFRALSEARLHDARVLLAARRYDAAYYLLGYAVECALKACIAGNTRQHDFPDQATVNQSYTHDLTQLFGIAGLQNAFHDAMMADETLARYWPLVSQWDEDSRYDSNVSEAEATDFFQAITDEPHGILPWIMQRW